MVKKSNDKWKICVDFTDLNKSCPKKDCFLLPSIDRMVDANAVHQLLTFMNAFFWYNQIFMHHGNHEKMSFITKHGTYCYKVMPFGLKNTRASYQRLLNKIFKDEIRKSINVYVRNETIIPAEIGTKKLRVLYYSEEANEQA